MKLRTRLLAAAFTLLMVSPASALIVGVSTGLSTFGGTAAIISAPANVGNSIPFNDAMQGFNEQQGFTLGANLSVDGGFIAGGTVVDSHMIFLNKQDNTFGTLRHLGVIWEFDGIVLGTMSDTNGVLEAASSGDLGATSTTYSVFNNRGFEGTDTLSFSTAFLTVSMNVTQPGDWIRVITQGTPSNISPVPVPAALPLFGTGLAIMGFVGWRRKRKASA